MRVIIAISAAILLIFCVATSAFVEKRAVQNVLKGEEDFINSLESDQQKWWAENRQKVFEFLVNTAVGASGESDLDEETVEEITDFIESLNATQQELWSKLQSKANSVVNTYVASRRAYHRKLELNRRGVCGGGCILSGQCAQYASGNRNCRCSWFSCKQY